MRKIERKNETKNYSARNVENSAVPSENQVKVESKIETLEKAESISETKKITDLNTDCMEIVFEYLKFNDLIAVADSSKRFYNAACQVYKRRFRNINPIFGKLKRYFW